MKSAGVEAFITILGTFQWKISREIIDFLSISMRYFSFSTITAILIIQISKYIYITRPVLMDSFEEKSFLFYIKLVNILSSIILTVLHISINPLDESLSYMYLTQQANGKDPSMFLFSSIVFLIVILAIFNQILLRGSNPPHLNDDLIKYSNKFEISIMLVTLFIISLFGGILTEVSTRPMTVNQARQLSLWMTISCCQFFYIKNNQKLWSHFCKIFRNKTDFCG